MKSIEGQSVDVVVVGAGLAGFGTAALLQARGLSTLLLEAHRQPGGCAGFWRTRGFSFDVGATTFVDFHKDGVGGRFLAEMRMDVPGELLAGYRCVLPDRTVTLWRDRERWARERLQAFGDGPGQRRFWTLIDDLSDTFWPATRSGRVRMPLRGLVDAVQAARSVPVRRWPMARYLRWTMGDALRAHGLREHRALCTMLGMLLEDTVHASVDEAPLVNGALGVNIRGAGLTRFTGGARGLWRGLIRRYRELGGSLKVQTPASRIERSSDGRLRVHTPCGTCIAEHVVSAIPVDRTAELFVEAERPLRAFIDRDAQDQGGAVLVMLGLPEDEIAGADPDGLTHHGLFQDYDAPFGRGNNMFISVSSPGDLASAPAGTRAVMISTHCELAPWQGLSDAAYDARKQEIGRSLVRYARRVYPRLAEKPVVYEVGTPKTYARFTGRVRGSVGGVRQRLSNVNQHAVPHDIGVPGLHVVGDTTWPGLGTVSCLVGARCVADSIAG